MNAGEFAFLAEQTRSADTWMRDAAIDELRKREASLRRFADRAADQAADRTLDAMRAYSDLRGRGR
ncbi:MAG: hypothetical protein AAFR76_01385 [Planctomycetota bacterium]